MGRVLALGPRGCTSHAAAGRSLFAICDCQRRTPSVDAVQRAHECSARLEIQAMAGVGMRVCGRRVGLFHLLFARASNRTCRKGRNGGGTQSGADFAVCRHAVS